MSKLFSPKTRGRLISGVLILVPFMVTLAVVFWLFGGLRQLIHPMIMHLATLTQR